MEEKYIIRLMFEWGGGCLWCGNDKARDNFGVGPIEDQLPLSENLRAQLNEMSTWHEQSLNRDYPPDPGPWSAEETEQFELATNKLIELLKIELGNKYELIYEQL